MDYGIFRGRLSIVCIGNELNGDDGAGRLVYVRLKRLRSAQVIYAHTAPENFLDEIIAFRPHSVVVIDAADYGGTPGEIRLLPVKAVQSAHFSTHRAPLKLFISQLGEHGLTVNIVGIQVMNTCLGEPLSGPVKKSVDNLVKKILSSTPE